MTQATQTATTPADDSPAPQGLRAIDCDVHPNFRQDWPFELAEFMPEAWRNTFNANVRFRSARGNEMPGTRLRLPGNPFYIKRTGNLRMDAFGEDGSLPGADPAVSAHQLFDVYGMDRAIALPQVIFGIGALPDPDAANVIAAATNRWLSEKWMASDDRWRAALIIAPQDVEESVREIHRWGEDKRFVAVYISINRTMLGNRAYNPIYEAAQHHGLPILLHPTANEGIYSTSASFTGTPVHQLDYRHAFTMPYQLNVANIVATGVLERFPRLNFIFAECGFSWLPDLMWRMDAYWRAGREETPWLRQPPSEYIKERMSFTTQPFIEPENPAHVHQMLDMIDAGRTLLFSSDYPHWDADEPRQTIAELPAAIHDRVMFQNAVDLFGDRLA